MSEEHDRYAWADYVIYMESGAELLHAPPAAKSRHAVTWGLLACLALAFASLALSRAPFWPFSLDGGRHPLDAIMIAILLGIVLRSLWTPPVVLQPGIQFAAKAVLPVGIVLLGARLDLRDLALVGGPGLLLSLIVISASVGLMLLLRRAFHLPAKLATLLGVGTAICGGSAIVAVAPLIEADEEDIVFSVTTVALLGLLFMFMLPVSGGLLSLDQTSFGLWAGLSIHQTPHVIAAGFAYGHQAGETATLVKLVGICLLAPVVFTIGLTYARLVKRETASATVPTHRYRDLVPGFVVGLLAMVAFRTVGLLPDLTFQLPEASLLGNAQMQLKSVDVAAAVSKLCIAISMSAIGLQTSFAGLRKTGPKPMLAALTVSVGVAILTLAAIRLLGGTGLIES
jgi:uncharacterized integral membrane protein (TIGR00698 family)